MKTLTDAVEGLIDLNVEMGNKASTSMQVLALASLVVMILIIVLSIVLGSKIAASVAKMLSVPILNVKMLLHSWRKGI